jgi:hypothetical protein
MTTEFEFAGSTGTYALFDSEGRLIFDVNRVRWVGDDLFGEVAVTRENKMILAPMAFVFTKGASRNELAQIIGGNDATDAVNELCRRVIQAERTNSSPVVCLRDAPKPTEDREYKIPLLPPLPRTSMAIWFGDGGTGKSLLALHAAGQLAKQNVRTLYLDWEWEVGEHRVRLERLFGTDMPAGLDYWQCDRPLPQMTDAIRRVIRERKIEYVVVDSIAYACGGDVESSEIASRYKVCTQAFGVGSLHLAHITKNANTNKPFGSAFWHNGARSTWYVERINSRERESGVTETDLRWYHRKSNLGPLETQPRLIQFAVDDANDTIRVAAFGDRTAMLTAGKVTTESRLRDLLAKQPRTREELRELLPSITPETLKKTIQRGLKGDPGKGKRGNGKTAWLAEGTDQKLRLVADSRAA